MVEGSESHRAFRERTSTSWFSLQIMLNFKKVMLFSRHTLSFTVLDKELKRPIIVVFPIHISKSNLFPSCLINFSIQYSKKYLIIVAIACSNSINDLLITLLTLSIAIHSLKYYKSFNEKPPKLVSLIYIYHIACRHTKLWPHLNINTYSNYTY